MIVLIQVKEEAALAPVVIPVIQLSVIIGAQITSLISLGLPSGCWPSDIDETKFYGKIF